MVTNVRIAPDTNPTLNILNSLGAERQRIDEMKLAEMARQKAQFQDLINKSFQTVSTQWQEPYSQMQDKFIKEASDVYKGSGGFLSMNDQLKLRQLQQPLEEYVAYANASQKLYSDLAQKIQLSDANKVNKNISLLNLKNAMEVLPGDTPQSLYTRLNSQKIVVDAIPFDVRKLASDFSKAALVNASPDEIKATTIKLPNGDSFVTTGVFKDEKWDQMVGRWYEDHKDLYTENNKSIEDFRAELEPYKNEYIKQQLVRAKKAGSGDGTGTGKNAPIIVTPTKDGVWDIEQRKRDVPFTVDNTMTLYDENNKKFSITDAIDSKIIGFEKRFVGGDNGKLYARVKVPMGKDTENVWTFRKDIGGGVKIPKEGVKIFYVPVEDLQDTWFEDNKIILKDVDAKATGTKFIIGNKYGL